MEKNKESIVYASIGKRVGAALVDLGLSFVIYLILLFTLGTGVLYSSFGLKADSANQLSYATDSKIFEYSNDSKTGTQVVGTAFASAQSSLGVTTPATYEIYYESLYYFYAEFLPNDSRISDNSKYSVSNFFYDVLGLPNYDEIKNLSKDELTDAKLAGSSKYYRYSLNGDGLLPSDISKASATLQDKYQNILSKGSDSDKDTLTSELNTYFYGDSSSPIYCANNILISETYYKNINSHAKMANWAMKLICFLPSSFIIFFLVPFCSKNGESFGKIIFKICLAKKDGYQVTFKEKGIRQGMMLVLGSLYVISPLSTSYAFMIMSGIYLLDYVIMAGSRVGNYRAIEDRIAGTIVVDKKVSRIYKNKEEEENLLNSETKESPKEKEPIYLNIQEIEAKRKEIFKDSD